MTETDQIPPIPKYPTGLKTRGKELWRKMHQTADFSDGPETVTIIEEACYLADEVKRLRDLVRKAGADTRVVGYNGQPVSMPEVSDLRANQTLLLSMIKSIRVSPEDGEKLSRSDIGRKGADARWNK
ncbi:hypothetical protein [Mycolicibacterium llatzerense]|uniref:hypothetical protein n=1 Tax=Mycolicibacterium llatzerense TaxID=280871 RepID=UPI0009F70B93|nr:hypothetical protein [Mycolicibacterium llatzerense]